MTIFYVVYNDFFNISNTVVRGFNGKNGYPTYEELSNFVKEYNYQTIITDNVIVAEKNN